MLNENEYKFILEQINVGVIISDEHNKIEFANSFVHKMFLYNEGELLGEELSVLVPDDFKENHTKLVKWFLQSPHIRDKRESSGKSILGKTKIGSNINIKIMLIPLKNKIVSIIQDLTEQTKLKNKITMNNNTSNAIKDLVSYTENVIKKILE